MSAQRFPELGYQVEYLTLEPLFLAMQEAFVAGGAARVRRATLEIAPWVRDSERHYAATTANGLLVIAAPAMADLPPDTALAIFEHEFGHVADALYPGDFVLTDDGELVKLPAVPKYLRDKRAEQANIARMRHWRERDADAIERTADALGEHFTGIRLGYCGPCSLQCFDRAAPSRPRGLR